MSSNEVYEIKKVDTPHDIFTEVPGSKSITNRALLIAAMSQGTSVIKGVLFSDDSRHFMQALFDLGFPIHIDEDNSTITIEGFGGEIPNEEAEVYVGSAGTAARFLTAFLGLSKGRYRLTCSEQMKKRPMNHKWEYRDVKPPFLMASMSVTASSPLTWHNRQDFLKKTLNYFGKL